MKAKKSFGQHFLINEGMSAHIASSLQMTGDIKNVLEIGPGKGVLTKYLAKQDTNFKVVEADQDMVAYLIDHKVLQQDQIIFLDFLKLNLLKVFDGQPFCLIGNYPYNISSQILIKMVNHAEMVPEMVG
ncbi:MAG TPA: rRNA adenine N-6-methyltransferase family protein, partial [Saprospiraceae bacterium]|nr:rRNA adenine N-6-methyltransferase family protein [Saprospiraceae bacterium]